MEKRLPPRNRMGDKKFVGKLLKSLQLIFDFQVFSVRKSLAAWLAVQTGKILEVGCGEQPYRELLPSACVYQGMDIVNAEKSFSLSNPENTIQYNGRDFPFSENIFSSLFHTEVLEHVYDLRFFLKECNRVLCSHGEMFFTIPFQARFHFIPNDYWRLTPSALELLLKETGFEKIQIIPRGTDITVAAYKGLAVLVRWVMGTPLEKVFFLLCAPLIPFFLFIAHLSIYFNLGSSDDCLGYSVSAKVVRKESL